MTDRAAVGFCRSESGRRAEGWRTDEPAILADLPCGRGDTGPDLRAGFGPISAAIPIARVCEPVVRNSRSGFGNRLILGPDDLLREPPVYRGKETKFWSRKVWSDSYDCPLYWCPKHEQWFRYHRDDDTYRPVPGGYDPTPAR